MQVPQVLQVLHKCVPPPNFCAVLGSNTEVAVTAQNSSISEGKGLFTQHIEAPAKLSVLSHFWQHFRTASELQLVLLAFKEKDLLYKHAPISADLITMVLCNPCPPPHLLPSFIKISLPFTKCCKHACL